MKIKKFKDFNMTTKIVLAFITMIVLAALMGAGSLWSVFIISGKTETINQLVLPQLEGSFEVERAAIKVDANLDAFKYSRKKEYLENGLVELKKIQPIIQEMYDFREAYPKDSQEQIEQGHAYLQHFISGMEQVIVMADNTMNLNIQLNEELKPVIDEMTITQESVTEKIESAKTDKDRNTYLKQSQNVNKIVNILYVMIINANSGVSEVTEESYKQVEGMLSAINLYMNEIPTDDELFTKSSYKLLKEKLLSSTEIFGNLFKSIISTNEILDTLKNNSKFYVDGAVNSSKNASDYITQSTQENLEYVKDIAGDVTWLFIIIMIIGVSCCIALPIFLARPLKKLQRNIRKFGNGDLTVKFSIEREDEIGEIAKALSDMSDKLRGIIGDISLVTGKIEESSDTFSTVTQKQSESSDRLTKQAQIIDSNAQEAASSVEEVNETVAEVAVGSQMITENTQDLSRFAGETSEKAEDGNTSVKNIVKIIDNAVSQSEETQKEVTSLADYAQNVMGIVDTIKAIAEQTNLLALNAAIEAARAGEAGKGFAVVADEIRKLADESKDATDRIYNMLTQIKTGSSNAKDATLTIVGMIGEIDKEAKKISGNFEGIIGRISQINERIESLTASSEEQSASSEEISAAVERIAYTVDEISKKIQDSTDAIEEQNEGMKKIDNSSASLKKLAEKLQVYVGEFKL